MNTIQSEICPINLSQTPEFYRLISTNYQPSIQVFQADMSTWIGLMLLLLLVGLPIILIDQSTRKSKSTGKSSSKRSDSRSRPNSNSSYSSGDSNWQSDSSWDDSSSSSVIWHSSSGDFGGGDSGGGGAGGNW